MKIVLDITPPDVTSQSSKKIRVAGRIPMMYVSAQGKEAIKLYHSHLCLQAPKTPLKGVLEAKYIFLYPYPLSWSKKLKNGKLYPKTTKPDWDNLPKMLQDIMTKLNFWKDDAVIFDGGLRKFYWKNGKIIINIKEFPYDTTFDLDEVF